MEIPSRVEAGEATVYDCTYAKRQIVLLKIAQAYVDGKLIEPLSREELEKILYENICDWNAPSRVAVYDTKSAVRNVLNALLGKVGKVQEDKHAKWIECPCGLRTASEEVYKLHNCDYKAKVQEDISNSMLRRFRVQHGLDIVTGKPHVAKRLVFKRPASPKK